MSTIRERCLRDLPHPNLNDVLKTNTHSAIKLLKTVGEFAHKVATLKEQLGNQLLSLVESFRKKNSEMKKDRNALSSAFSCWETLLGEYEKQAQDMLKISSSLVRQVNTAVFEEVVKKKAATKKIFSFRDSSENQIEKADEVLQKCHKEYSEACTKLAKLQSTGAEPGKQEHVQTLCRNTHNAYVLQLNTVNNMNSVFYSTTLPEMLDIMTAVTSQQCLPEMIKDIPPGHVKDMVLRLCGHTDRTNKTHLKNEFYAIGALKKGTCTPGAPFEDDLLLFLGVESIGCVTFFKRLQIGDAVIHSKMYKRVSRRNSFTVAYKKSEGTSYGQIEVFFLLKENTRMTCGAIIAPMSKSNELICESHVVLGRPVDHIVSLHQAKRNRFDIVPFEDIIDVCLYMKFLDSEDLQLVQEDVSESLKVALTDFSNIEKDNIIESVQRLENIEHMFQMINSREDISTFVQANNPGTYTSPIKSFSKPEESQSLNLGDNKLFLVDVTEPVLKRKYIALQKKLRNFDTTIKKDQEAVKSLKQLQESYLQNPSYGNATEVEEDLLKQRNDLRIKEWFCCVAKEQTKLFTGDVLNRLQVTEDDLQDETISDDESVTGTVDKRQSVHSAKGKKIRKAGQHQFEDHTFKKPKFCYYCKGLIKGLIRQGVRCKACKMSVHHKCRDNVPYCPGDMSGGKGQSLRIQRTQEDDSDDPVYSDVDDAPTPPPHRRALGPTASLPVFRGDDDFYDTAGAMISSSDMNCCVALYDFDGENEGDLKLCAGEKVKVINSADDNWWEGSSKGQTGFFPASYVQIISPDDVILRCLFDFSGQEGDELTIQANQIIVQVRNEGNGWIVGRTGSVEGAFPASYVEELSNNGPD